LSFPVLDTPRLTLRPAALGDTEALHALWTIPEVRRFLFDDVAPSREQADALLEGALRHAADGFGLWVVTRTGQQDIIGAAGLLPVGAAAEVYLEARSMIEPLIAFDPAAWGRGLAAEALGALLTYGFETLKLAELVALTDAPNAASQRLLEWSGFAPAGEAAGSALPFARLVPDAPGLGRGRRRTRPPAVTGVRRGSSRPPASSPRPARASGRGAAGRSRRPPGPS
jgi:[ribosomal protein S5]-alanine N-acetyltransferase